MTDAMSTIPLHDLETRYPPRSLPSAAQVVRVAPSPTGKPHIGTALQAVIDHAMARSTQGVFILRIEDTDRKRLVPGATDEIVEGLRWLDVEPDEGPAAGGAYGPYFESERLAIYRSVAHNLVDLRAAYVCRCSPERLASLRESQQAAGLPPRYDRHCREMNHDKPTPEQPGVIRLAMPLAGDIRLVDVVRGAVSFDARDQDDAVIMKSDGFPTYHLASTVDDHFMRVTTVVRGEEWISSAPKHLVLYAALGWQPPRFVHTPLLRDASRRKLGKRTGDTSLAWFRAQGYLPGALRNWITRIIWTHPGSKDVYDYDEFVRQFNPSGLTTTAPVADIALLEFICGEYLRRLSAPQLYDTLAGWLHWLIEEFQAPVGVESSSAEISGPPQNSHADLVRFRDAFTANRAFSLQVLSLEPERYHKLADVLVHARFFYAELFIGAAPELLAKQTRGNADLAVSLLEGYLELRLDASNEESWQAATYRFAEDRSVKAGFVFMLLRVALTGSDRSPPLFPIIRILPAEETDRRIRSAVVELRRYRPHQDPAGPD